MHTVDFKIMKIHC